MVDHTKINELDSAKITKQLLTTIKYLNSLNVCHRDIKPDNILLQGDHAKVGDFGLAKDLNVTNVSVINGFTPTFAAPELFEGRPGRATDQYSLAIVYQYMLTGVLPFNGRTAAQLTAQHLRSQPDVSNLQPIDRPVVARALSKNMHSRFDNCRQFIDELAKRKHGRATNKVFVQQPVNGDLARTALLKTQGCLDGEAVAREESVPVAISPEAETAKSLRPENCALSYGMTYFWLLMPPIVNTLIMQII